MPQEPPIASTSSQYTPESFKGLLKKLVKTPDQFDIPDLELAVEHVSHAGGTTQAQTGAWLTALHLTGKDKDAKVLASYAKQARNKATAVDLPDRGAGPSQWVVDIVGTGGDGQDTFNASTAASIIVAGSGVRVCKHGSKASTSTTGSADFLTALGCPVMELPPSELPLESPYLFLFAMAYHPTFAITSPVRRELGFPTIYNIMGPLINPARPDAMVLGVYHKDLGQVFAEALRSAGMQRAWVVCGFEGLDELSPAGQSHVWDLQQDGTITYRTVSPADFGLQQHPLDSVRSCPTAQGNAETFRALLSGKLQQDSPIESFVVLNAAALLYVSGKAADLRDGTRIARESISSGRAATVLEQFGKQVSAGVERSKQVK